MKSFQIRARAVRAESRELMARLRQERTAMSRHARRSSPAPAIVEAPPKAAAVAQAQPATTIIPSRKIRAAADAPTPLARKAPASRKPKIDTPKIETPRSEAGKAEQPRAKRPAPPRAEPATEAKPAVAPAPAPKPRPGRPRASVAAIIADGLQPVAALQQAVASALDAAAAASPRADRPVSAVPSLGPGMVWRLNQLGIRTTSDLAAADAAVLRDKLGKLGRMVNVEQWIAFARTR